MDKQCTHRGEVKDVIAKDEHVCEDCKKTGDSWVGLRMCLSCGHVGCCDSSRNRHASRHYSDTKHPIMKSVGLSEPFMWCYVDNMYL